jgi:Tfp pilus assembly protein PilO
MTTPRWAKQLRSSARHPWARGGLRACMLAGATVAVALAAWWPVEHERAVLEDQVGAKRRALAQARQAHGLLEAYTKAAKDVALLEKKLEYAATQAQLVENFSRLAGRHGVKILSETYDEGRGGAVQSGLSAELSVQGSFPALRDFLRDLSALPTWSEVQEVRLETVQGSATQKGRIRVVTYRAAPAERGKAS